MIVQSLKIIHGAISRDLQTRLDALGVDAQENVPAVQQYICPMVDDFTEPHSWPAVITSLAPTRSPSASFQVFGKADVWVPVSVVYATNTYDMAVARREVGMVLQALIHVLNDVLVGQESIGFTRLLEIADLVMDYVKDDGDHIGGAIFFDALMRDETP